MIATILLAAVVAMLGLSPLGTNSGFGGSGSPQTGSADNTGLGGPSIAQPPAGNTGLGGPG